MLLVLMKMELQQHTKYQLGWWLFWLLALAWLVTGYSR
jgi:hypothetical protein